MSVLQAAEDRDALCAAVQQYLKDVGIKTHSKLKTRPNTRSDKARFSFIFGGCLSCMPQVTISADGNELRIPSFLWMSTKLLRRHIRTEGLFRKGGSISRQKELKKILENGGVISDQADIHDVANLVKQFLRGLAEPLLPLRLHAAFIKAYDIENSLQRTETVLMICLLLPIENLHTLRYVLTFFAEIAKHSSYNKMDVYNLAIVLAPNLFVLTNEMEKREKVRDTYLAKQTGLIQLLIENANTIGSVPDHLLDIQPQFSRSEDDLDVSQDCDFLSKKRNRKKRNSLNGVLHGLRKMVNVRTMGSSIWHDDDDGALVDHERGLERTPSQALKRKHIGEQPQCSNAKQAVVRGAKSSKLVPVPVIHLDSPNPIAQSEDQVFASPMLGIALGDSSELQRKSCRMKIFGKAYLCSRTTNLRTSKSVTKPSKKDVSSSAKKQGNEHVGRRLSGDDSLASPTLPLTPYKGTMQLRSQTKITDPRPQEMLSAPAKACVLHDEHKVPHRLAECSYGLSPVCLSRLSRSPRLRDFLDWKTTVLVSPGLSEAEVSPKSNWKGRKSKLMDKLNAEVKMGVSPRRSRSINRWKSPRDDIGMNDIELFTPPRHPVMKPTGYRSTLRRGRPNTIRTGLPPPPSPQAKLEMTSESSPGRTLLHYTSDPGPISETKTSLIQVSSPLRISHPNAASSVRTLKLPNHCESTALDVQKVLTFEAEPEPDQQQVKGSRQLDHHHPSRECVEPQSSSMKNVDSGIFEMVSSDEFEVLDIDIKSRSLNASTGSIEKLANISRKLTLEESVAVKGKSVNPSTPSSPTSRGALPLTKGASLSATSVPLAADPRQPKVVEWRPASLVLTTDNASWSDENQTAVFRPSIARLMREKAGSVSAATKKFNALAEQSEQEFRGPPTPSINSLCWHSPTFITPVSGARKSIPCPLSNTQNESHFRKKTMTGSERKMNCKDFHTATIMTRECDPFSEKLLRPWSRDSVKENLPPTAHQRATRNKSTSSPTCHSSSDAKPRSQSSRTKATLNSPSFRPRHVAGVSRSKSARVASLATISPDLVVRRSPRLRYKKGHQKSMGGEQPRRLQTLPRRTTSI